MASDTMSLLALIGIPGAALVAGLFRFRPIRTIRDWQYLATGLVASVQKVRDGRMPEDRINLDLALDATQDDRLKRLIIKAKLALAKRDTGHPSNTG